MKIFKVRKSDRGEWDDKATKIIYEIKHGSAYFVGPFRLFLKNNRITASAPRKGETSLTDEQAFELIKSALMAKKQVMLSH